MSIKYLTPIDMGKLEVLNLRLQNLAAAPPSPVAGQTYFDTVLGHEYVYNGSGWEQGSGGGGSGTVTTVSVASANGFAGTVANASSTPAITLTTSVTGVLKGNGTAVSAASANSDYLPPASPAITGTATFAGSSSGTTGLLATAAAGSTTLTLPAATDTLVGKATTDTLTNKTFDTAGTGNVFRINGTGVTAVTGTGSAVLSASPTLTGTLSAATVTASGAVTGSNLSGTNTGDQTSVSGNAGTATALQTGRAVNGVTFDGTAAITVTAAAGTLTGATLAAGVTASSLTSVGTIATGVWNGTALTATYLPALNAITAPAADLSLNTHRITNLVDPAAAQDAATKNYVDLAVQGTPTKATAYYATTAVLPACTYANGTSGVGATLTGNANGALAAVDGQTPAAGDVVLVKNQAAAIQNGVYTLTTLGTGSVPFVLTRSTTMDSSAEFSGAVVAVESGTTNAGSLWICAINAPTVGTTAVAFTEINKAADLQQGSGVTITGNTIAANVVSVAGRTGTVTLTSTDVGLANVENTTLSTWAGSANVTTLGTVATGTWSATTVALNKGGTGQTTATAARQALVAVGVYNAAGSGSGTTFTITQATHGLGTSGNSYTDIDPVCWDVSANPAVRVFTDTTVNTSTGDVVFTFASSQTLTNFRFAIFGK